MTTRFGDYIPELKCYLSTTSTENLHNVFEDWHTILTRDWRKRLSHDELADFDNDLKKTNKIRNARYDKENVGHARRLRWYSPVSADPLR